MGKSIAVEKLIGRIYESATEPALWSTAVAEIAEAAGCRNSVIYEHDLRARASVFLGTHGVDPHFSSDYESYAGGIDPWTERARAWPVAKLVATYALISDAEFRRTEFYQSHLRQQKIFYGLGGVVGRTRERMAIFGVDRDYGDGRFPIETTELIGCLMPHLSRAYRLLYVLRNSKARGDRLAEALHLVQQPVLIVGRDSRLVFANQAAEALLAESDGIRLVAGHVLPTRRDDRALFLALLQDDLQVKRRPLTLRLRRKGGRLPLAVEATPLSAGSDQVALLFDVPAAASTSAEALAHRFAVSPAEARLWSDLVAGATLAEISERRRLSVNTLRVQLAGLFQKLGLHRQADLIRLALDRRTD
jgi:DNA-binding CsgD family transcriptional regulator